MNLLISPNCMYTRFSVIFFFSSVFSSVNIFRKYMYELLDLTFNLRSYVLYNALFSVQHAMYLHITYMLVCYLFLRTCYLCAKV